MNAPFSSETLCSWRELPEVQRLLRICAVERPSTHEFRYAGGETDVRYVGTAPRDLKKLYNDHAERLVAEMERTGDRAALLAHMDDSPSKAITDAIVAAQNEKVAA